MTNEEAIKILQNDGCCQDCTFGGYPCKLVGCETHQAIDLAIKALEDKPQAEMIETKHRLNLLIGVLYSNQLISENDLEYIEDSIKELMKGGAE